MKFRCPNCGKDFLMKIRILDIYELIEKGEIDTKTIAKRTGLKEAMVRRTADLLIKLNAIELRKEKINKGKGTYRNIYFIKK